MSIRAKGFVGLVMLIGATLGILTIRQISWSPDLLLPFGLLVVLAIIAQLSKIEAPNHMAFFATPLFYFASLLLLPLGCFVIVVMGALLVEWFVIRFLRPQGKHLRAWYIQPFNVAMHIVAGSVALWASTMLPTQFNLTGWSQIVTALTAASCYLIVNQLLLGQALVLARGISWRESDVLKLENLLPEYIMLCLGAVIARLWILDSEYIVLALLPLVLMYRNFEIPKLREEAQTDGKTGLANARHFKKRFTEELDRAQRFNRPLALIMADLDLLRTINNTYGHLAGDVVIEGIGKLIRQAIREYDIAGRFGGEEFAIVLPETGEAEARLLAERIRQLIEEAQFTVSTSSTPIRATMSLGVACYPNHAIGQEELTHQADVAVYQAKFNGRNRVMSASDVPHSATLEHTPINLTAPSTYAIVSTAQPTAATQPVAVEAPAALPVAQSEPAGLIVEGKPDRRRHRRDAAGTRLRPALLIVVAGTVLAGVYAAHLGWDQNALIGNLYPLLALMTLAFLIELLQISVYGEHSMSVSLALILAATLIGGMNGAVLSSAAVVIADQLRRQRPLNDSYKLAFNWAIHVLAAVPLIFLLDAHTTRIVTSNLPRLGLMIVLATGCYYAIETSLIAIVISLSNRQSPFIVWRTQFRWLAHHYFILGLMGLCISLAYQGMGLLGIGAFALPLLIIRYAQQQYVERTKTSVQELKRMNQELLQANQEVDVASQAIQQLNQELFVTLGSVLDARDPYVTGHAMQVATYATAIARELGLPAERIEIIHQAGFLHDLGKIAITEQILFKPEKLTVEEFEIIKTHAAIGAAMLEMSQGLRHLAPFLRHHHERWDGGGYPDGLAGEQIPLEARILSVCDAVEAMAADRPYHVGVSLPEILAEVRRNAGTQFDPQIAEVFVRIASREGGSLVVNSAREVLRKQEQRGTLLTNLVLQL